MNRSLMNCCLIDKCLRNEGTCLKSFLQYHSKPKKYGLHLHVQEHIQCKSEILPMTTNIHQAIQYLSNVCPRTAPNTFCDKAAQQHTSCQTLICFTVPTFAPMGIFPTEPMNHSTFPQTIQYLHCPITIRQHLRRCTFLPIGPMYNSMPSTHTSQ